MISICEAMKELLWLRHVLNELVSGSCVTPTEVFEDNQGCISLANVRKYSERSKHIEVRYLFAREMVLERKEAKLTYLLTTDMIADMFTKPLPRIMSQKFRTRLGVEKPMT